MAEDTAPQKPITIKDIAVGFSTLLGMFATYRAEMTIFVTLGILESFGNAFVPLITGSIVDALVAPTQTMAMLGFVVPAYFWWLGAWFVAEAVIVLIDRHISRESDVTGIKVWGDAMVRGYTHLLKMPLAFHKTHKIGESIRTIQQGCDGIESIGTNIIIQLTPQLLSIVIALGFTLYLSPTLGMFLLGAMLLYLVIFIRGIVPLAALQRVLSKENPHIWGDTHELVEYAREVKEAAAEDRAAHAIRDGFRVRIVGNWSAMFRAWGDLSFYQRTVIVLAQLGVFAYSIVHILAGSMTIGELLAINGYAQMVFGPFVILGRNWQNVQNGIININRAEELLALPIEETHPTGSDPSLHIAGAVTFDHVTFSYTPERTILRDISFSVEPGQTIAIVGESGVGKTTLVDLLLGFQHPTEGRVLIDGHDVRTLDLQALRRQVAIVSQDIVLFNDTISNNIAYGLDAVPHDAIERAASDAAAQTFIEAFPDKWEQIVGERGIKLSGGQRQRVAIARAILKDPSILVLDEPTSALDARTEHALEQSLREIMAGKTTFVIAHRFSTVRHADTIIVLKDGTICEQGTHTELIAHDGEYKHLYELQIGLHA